jgi:DHA2 family multidrug resistance protein
LGAHINSAAIDVIDVSTIDRFQALGSTVLSYVDALVTRQAAMIAYIDNFYIMMWATIVATPLALLLRRTVLRPGEKPPPPDAH